MRPNASLHMCITRFSVSASQWNAKQCVYIPTKHNPAVFASRSVQASGLVETIWLCWRALTLRFKLEAKPIASGDSPPGGHWSEQWPSWSTWYAVAGPVSSPVAAEVSIGVAESISQMNWIKQSRSSLDQFKLKASKLKPPHSSMGQVFQNAAHSSSLVPSWTTKMWELEASSLRGPSGKLDYGLLEAKGLLAPSYMHVSPAISYLARPRNKRWPTSWTWLDVFSPWSVTARRTRGGWALGNSVHLYENKGCTYWNYWIHGCLKLYKYVCVYIRDLKNEFCKVSGQIVVQTLLLPQRSWDWATGN